MGRADADFELPSTGAPLRVVVAGGGTGGHAYPAIAVAEILRSRGATVVFIGTKEGPEARLARNRGFDFVPIQIEGRRRRLDPKNFLVAFRLVQAVFQCLRALGRIDPHVVIGTGGYVSLPANLAAYIHRIPVLLHEQNSVPGFANRLSGRFARAIGVSFPGTEARFGPKSRLVGNPVRKQIAEMDRQSMRPIALEHFGLAGGRKTLLVTGGSQGARSINEAMLSVYSSWRHEERMQVLHLAGERNWVEVETEISELRRPSDSIVWRVLGFTDRMELALSVADLAVSRAGASTIAELTAAAVPSILVPYPYSLDQDQLRNAEFVRDTGAAEVLEDSQLHEHLAQTIESVLLDHTKLSQMSESASSLARPNAAEKLADLAVEVASGRAVTPNGSVQIPSAAPERLEVSAGPPPSEDLGFGWKRAHLVGIGGAGMNAIARVLLAMGVEVTGSDQRDSGTLSRLRDLGVRIEVGHRAEAAEGADAVVVSAAVQPSNPELEAAERAGIPVIKRAKALAMIVEGKKTIAISGTHGKSTTSAMLVRILEEAGVDPTYLIGADFVDGAPGGKLGRGSLAVVEADEAYGSFLELAPWISLVTNIDPDHLDFYGSMDALESAFESFFRAGEIKIVCADNERAVRNAGVVDLTYGLTQGADVVAQALELGASSSTFRIVAKGDDLGETTLRVPGRHKVQNALGAAAAALAAGVDGKSIVDGLAAYRGVGRRFEYRGTYRGADLVDDYAHHPTEITATLEAAKSGPWKRVLAVFQPHLYSRTQAMWRELGSALGSADVVVVVDVYGAREDPVPGVTGKIVAEAVCEARPGLRVAYLPRLDEAAVFLRGVVRPGDVVLSMGAGDVTTLPERLKGP